jgi:radical SAM protein with 4Fe4S-binding SPASM domain
LPHCYPPGLDTNPDSDVFKNKSVFHSKKTSFSPIFAFPLPPQSKNANHLTENGKRKTENLKLETENLKRQTLTTLPLWKIGESGRIPMISMNLEITERCNNNCRHCYINLPANDTAAKAKELSLADIERIADDAVSAGVLWVLISGGEPLLREDFPEIFLSLKKKGFLVSVFTNATLLSPSHVQMFKAYPPRELEVSVYGVTAAVYETVTRRPGSFNAFMRGLDLLEKGGQSVTLKAMALRSNVNEMHDISAFCRARSRNPFRFDPLLHLRYDRNPERNEEIRSERLTAEEIVELEKIDPARIQAIQKMCDPSPVARPGSENDAKLFLCGTGIGECTVGADGRFRLCSSLCHPDCLYDLKAGSFEEAMTDFVPRIRSLQSHRPAFIHSCNRCPLINLCHWCPAHAYLETGEMDASVDYFCEVARARVGNEGEMP